jgi:hypothetical protein
VGVRDIIAELRAFPAYIAYLCHDLAPNSGLSRWPEMERQPSPEACRIFIIPASGGWAKPRSGRIAARLKASFEARTDGKRESES